MGTIPTSSGILVSIDASGYGTGCEGPPALRIMRVGQDPGPPLGTPPENPFRFVLAKTQEIRHFLPEYLVWLFRIGREYISPI